MDKETFLALKDLLVSRTRLEATDNICTGEKLFIFLFIISGNSNRTTQERWQHSGETISRTLHEVAAAILELKEIISKPPGMEVSDRIRYNPKFWPYRNSQFKSDKFCVFFRPEKCPLSLLNCENYGEFITGASKSKYNFQT
jgi:hypothetical protein